MIVQSLLILVLVAVEFAISSDPCQTPTGENGICVHLTQCSSLQSHMKKASISSRYSNSVRRSHCGLFSSHPKVCCPTKSTDPGKNPIASSHLLPDPSTCGLHISDKIVGGEKTLLDEFPWMALLQFQLDDGSKSFECGGSLINNRYVLTAAHCLLPQLIGVRLGEYNTETNPDCVYNAFGADCAPKVQDFGIEEKLIYKSYDPQDPSHYHDIGLIRLDRDVEFSDFIKPICLPLTPDEIYKSYTGKKLTVSGWGLTEKGVKSSIKLKVQVPVRDLDECMASFKKVGVNVHLDAGQVCAGGVAGRDSCKADSGGPLMNLQIDKNREAHFYAIGVVSYGANPCGQQDLPGVYTKVSKYVSWIVGSLRP